MNSSYGGGGAGRREVPVPKLASLEIADFRAWADQIKAAATANEWNADADSKKRSVHQVLASLPVPATQAISHLDTSTLTDVDALVKALANLLISPAQSEAAHAAFEEATQEMGETDLQYSVRLRNLFSQARPGEDYQNSRDLRNRFYKGMLDQGLARQILCTLGNKATYDEITNRTMEMNASLAILNPSGAGRLNAMTNPRGGRGRFVGSKSGYQCYNCQEYGHFRADCPKPRAADGHHGNRGRGGFRGRGRGRGRGRYQRGPRVNAIEDPNSEVSAQPDSGNE